MRSAECHERTARLRVRGLHHLLHVGALVALLGGGEGRLAPLPHRLVQLRHAATSTQHIHAPRAHRQEPPWYAPLVAPVA
eukprot:6184225-Pleurochrysis_carterae.AAC.1